MELGADRHGTWLWMPDQTPVRTRELTYMATRGLRLFRVGADWSTYFLLACTGRPKQLYVDITTPATRTDDLFEFIDLDLDVEQLDDGDVRILDEEEFALHRSAYRYPPHVADRALQTSQ